jgi:hypothetical protein
LHELSHGEFVQVIAASSERQPMKRPIVITASVSVALAAGLLLWNQVQTVLHDAAAQVAELQKVAPTIAYKPTPSALSGTAPTRLKEPTEKPQSSGDAGQLAYEDDNRRAKRFLLNRYYPDLQKATDFGSEDVAKLLSLWPGDEAELEKGLGAAKYQRWKEYEVQVQSADAVKNLGRNLSGDDQLREYQADMLYQTIFKEKRRRDEELRMRTYATPSDPRLRLEFEFGNLAIKEESDQRILAAAKSFLSEQQFNALPEAVIDPNVAATRENLERIRPRVERGSER